MQSRGQLEPDEDVLEDGIAFAGVSRYPARVKCALLGLDGVEGRDRTGRRRHGTGQHDDSTTTGGAA